MKINIFFDVTTQVMMTLDRNELPQSHQALLDSITADELATAPHETREIEWNDIKTSWRDTTTENTTVTDENEEELFWA